MKKKQQVQDLVIEMLNSSFEAMKKKAIEAINSDAVNTENWSEVINPMILPKTIVSAVLERECTQYIHPDKKEAKKQRKEINHIKYYI